MSAYIGYSPSFQVDTTNQLSDQVISIVQGQTEYTLTFAPNSDNLLIVSVNGSFYVPTIDYYVLGNKITFTNLSFPDSGVVYIYFLGSNYFRLNTVTDSSIQIQHLSSELKMFEFQIFTGDGTTKEFLLTFVPGSSYSVLVFIAGVLQKPAVHYMVVNKTLSFVSAPANNSEIVIRNMAFKGTEAVYQIPSQAVTEDKIAPLAISTSKIQDSAITFSQIQDSTISFQKLNGGVVSNIFFYEEVASSLELDSSRSYRLLVDTSTNSVSITLPQNPVIGQLVEILDSKDAFDEYLCTILRNGNKLDGQELDVAFYKRGVHCTFIFVGSGNWKLVYYDEGTEFLGVQNAIRAACEGRFVPEGSLFFSDLTIKGKFPWVYTVAPSVSSVNSYGTASVIYTFRQGSVAFRDIGSGILPTLTATLSDGSTSVVFTFNPSTSTLHSLVFDFTVPSGMGSSFLTVNSFDPGNFAVTINGIDFDVSECDLDLTMVMTERFFRNEISSQWKSGYGSELIGFIKGIENNQLMSDYQTIDRNAIACSTRGLENNDTIRSKFWTSDGNTIACSLNSV